MKRLSKKKNIAIWIVLIILIIIGLRVFTKSKASKIETITANFKDNSGILSDEISEVLATNEGDSGVSLILPDIVKDKKISKYIVLKKDIINDENNINEETNYKNNQIKSWHFYMKMIFPSNAIKKYKKCNTHLS